MSRPQFIVYRQGAKAFSIESRTTGEIRHASSAVLHREIMTDDSIKITLMSVSRMEFRLRDYIVYNGKPYFLNRIPEATIDNLGRYVYTLSFEGAMYELGRTAFIIPEATRSEYYGSLYDFGRLIVDNMNRNNMYVEWNYEDPHGEDRVYRAKLFGTCRDPRDITTLYMWGVGFNHELEGMGERFIYTIGLPVIDDESEVHAVDPETLTPILDLIVTKVGRWEIDFPKKKKIPAVYPQPTQQSTEQMYVVAWDMDNPVVEDIDEKIEALEYNISYSEGSYEYEEQYSFYGIDEDENPSPVPQFPRFLGDKSVVYKNVYVTMQKTIIKEDHMSGDLERITSTEQVTLSIAVTYSAKQVLQSEWEIEPVTPSHGSTTDEPEDTENKLLTYDANNCLSVIQDLVAQWEDWEWSVDPTCYDYVNGQMLCCGKIVLKRKYEFDEGMKVHSLGFGRGKGLKRIAKKYADSTNIPSRIYFYGGSNNVPQYYRSDRVCLPQLSRNDSYIDFAKFTQTDFQLGIDNTICEEIKVFNDIYPANKPFTINSNWQTSLVYEILQSGTERHYLSVKIPCNEFFDIKAEWHPYNLEGQNIPIVDFTPFPDYKEWLDARGLADSQEHRDRYEKYYSGTIDEPKNISKYMIGGQTPSFVFQGGALGGYSLTLHDFRMSDIDGVKCYEAILNSVNEKNEDVEGYYVPNEEMFCKTGDQFIVDNVNMPPQYTYYQGGGESDFSAENQLWEKALEHMKEITEKIDYEIEIAKDYVVKNDSRFDIFEGVQFSDILTKDNPLIKKRIVSVELNLVDGYDYKLKITNRGMVRKTDALKAMLGIRRDR